MGIRDVTIPLSRPNECVPDLQYSGVVYEIRYGHCPKVYIVLTGHRLNTSRQLSQLISIHLH